MLYNEKYRPQFHFTSRENWLNDPNGLVYCNGEYHMYYQHNPFEPEWGCLSWGHAVSVDLVHWKQLPPAITPDKFGYIASGSAVVDKLNSSGFKTGKESPVVAIYTASNGFGHPGKIQQQCIAYSNDNGRKWVKYEHNPVVGKSRERMNDPNSRDPKVFWYSPTQRWIMVLYEKDGLSFFHSINLRQWEFLNHIEGFYECPDIFEISVHGKQNDKKWVLLGADGHYFIGCFDGQSFVKESGPFISDQGSNFYASQTYNNIPVEDGRIIQIAWMRGGIYPGMPFNQQMTFPCECSLKSTPDGIRMHRYPVKEIELLYTSSTKWSDIIIMPDINILKNINGEIFDIYAKFEIMDAFIIGFRIRDETIRYYVNDQTIRLFNKNIKIKPRNNQIDIRILVDRTSMELFVNDGETSASFCFLAEPEDLSLELYVKGGKALVKSLIIHKLKSIWSD